VGVAKEGVVNKGKSASEDMSDKNEGVGKIEGAEREAVDGVVEKEEALMTEAVVRTRYQINPKIYCPICSINIFTPLDKVNEDVL
jgi:hypothetical protein